MKQKLLKASWIYGLIITIISGLLIIPLCWTIPMNVHLYKCYKENKTPGIAYTICYAFFVEGMVAPWIFLALMDKKVRHQYMFIVALINCILIGSSLIPLIWMIPLTINMYKDAYEDQPVGPYTKFFWLALMNVSQGVMLLVEDSLDEKVVEVVE